MTAYEYIRDCVNTKLEPSKINGVGVFALRDISQNEGLFRLWEGTSGEHILSNNELELLPYSIKTHLLDMYGYKQIGESYTMFVILNTDCHWIFKTPLHWVNSCGFNETPNIDRETLRANRFIKQGEEILLKYGKYDKFKRNKTI